MSVSENLERSAEWAMAEVTRLRDLAFEEESAARKHRAKADQLELDAIEDRSAARIIRDVGLSVYRDSDGVPGFKVERLLAPLATTTEETTDE